MRLCHSILLTDTAVCKVFRTFNFVRSVQTHLKGHYTHAFGSQIILLVPISAYDLSLRQAPNLGKSKRPVASKNGHCENIAARFNTPIFNVQP